MSNESPLTAGTSTLVDTQLNTAGTRGLKRGYGAEVATSNTDVLMHQGVAIIPSTIGAVAAATAAAATAALPATASKVNYLAGFSITGGGATAASVIKATITGIGYTWTIDIAVPAGATLGIAPLIVHLPNPMAATAASAAITLVVPSFGTGNLGVDIAVWGYQSPA